MKPARESDPYSSRLMLELAEIGYSAQILPKPLIWDAPNEIAGWEIAQAATANSPVDLGDAEIIAVDSTPHSLFVLRLGESDFYGTIQHDLFFAGPSFAAKGKGRLFFAHNYCVLCSEGCTIGKAVETMRKIPIYRSTEA